MGREALIDYICGKQRAQVRAHLDSLSLQLSGAKKLTVPLGDVRSAVVDGEVLTIVAKNARFSLMLGAKDAASWARKILNPPTLADKLGVKPGVAVVLVGERVAEIDEAAPAAKRIATLAAAKSALGAHDIAIVTLAPAAAEKDIAAAAKLLGAKTALWLVYRKGTKPNGDGIIACARKAGLKDTKVARVSETHAGLRFIRGKA